jgi:hypothetical protein
LRSKGRLSYQALKVRFHIDDQVVEGLKAELIDAERLAIDEDGKVLVWQGHSSPSQTPNSEPRTPNSSNPPPPISYTPKHLAERILAVRAAIEGERKIITALFADLKLMVRSN